MAFVKRLASVTPRITKHMIAPFHSPSDFADSSSMLLQIIDETVLYIGHSPWYLMI